MVSKKRLMLNISTLHLVFYASVVAKIIGSSAIENIIKDTQQCHEIEYFNPMNKTCTPIIGGGRVILVDQNKQCVKNSIGVKPYPGNDQFYYVCEPEFVILGSCPDAQIFNTTTSHCEPNRKLPCDLLQMPKCSETGRFALNSNCSCFYTCDKIGDELIPKLHQCPGTSLYSPSLKRCSYSCRNPPTEVKNEQDIDPNESNLFPPCTKPGQFRTPTDCTKYYSCSAKTHGRFYQTRFKCPDATAYDLRTESCRPRDEVVCEIKTVIDILNLYEFFKEQRQMCKSKHFDSQSIANCMKRLSCKEKTEATTTTTSAQSISSSTGNEVFTSTPANNVRTFNGTTSTTQLNAGSSDSQTATSSANSLFQSTTSNVPESIVTTTPEESELDLLDLSEHIFMHHKRINESSSTPVDISMDERTDDDVAGKITTQSILISSESLETTTSSNTITNLYDDSKQDILSSTSKSKDTTHAENTTNLTNETSKKMSSNEPFCNGTDQPMLTSQDSIDEIQLSILKDMLYDSFEPVSADLSTPLSQTQSPNTFNLEAESSINSTFNQTESSTKTIMNNAMENLTTNYPEISTSTVEHFDMRPSNEQSHHFNPKSNSFTDNSENATDNSNRMTTTEIGTSSIEISTLNERLVDKSQPSESMTMDGLSLNDTESRSHFNSTDNDLHYTTESRTAIVSKITLDNENSSIINGVDSKNTDHSKSPVVSISSKQIIEGTKTNSIDPFEGRENATTFRGLDVTHLGDAITQRTIQSNSTVFDDNISSQTVATNKNGTTKNTVNSELTMTTSTTDIAILRANATESDSFNENTTTTTTTTEHGNSQTIGSDEKMVFKPKTIGSDTQIFSENVTFEEATDNIEAVDQTSKYEKIPVQSLLNMSLNDPNSLSSSTEQSWPLTTKSTIVNIQPNASTVNESNDNFDKILNLESEIESGKGENVTSSDSSLVAESNISPFETISDESSPISTIQSITTSIFDASTLNETDALSTEMSTLPGQSLSTEEENQYNDQNKTMEINRSSTIITPEGFTTEIEFSTSTETIQMTGNALVNLEIPINNATDVKATIIESNSTSPSTSSTEKTTSSQTDDFLKNTSTDVPVFNSTNLSNPVQTVTESDLLSTADREHPNVEPLRSESLTTVHVNTTTKNKEDLIETSTSIPPFTTDSVITSATSEAKNVHETATQKVDAIQTDYVSPEHNDPVVSRLLESIPSKSNDLPSNGSSEDTSKTTSDILFANSEMSSTTITSSDQSTAASNLDITKKRNATKDDIRTNASTTTRGIESEVTTVNESSSPLSTALSPKITTSTKTPIATDNAEHANSAQGIHNEYLDITFPRVRRDMKVPPKVTFYIKRKFDLKMNFTSCCESEPSKN